MKNSFFKTGSLQTKIVLWTGWILAAVAVALTAYATITARRLAVQTAEKEAPCSKNS